MSGDGTISPNVERVLGDMRTRDDLDQQRLSEQVSQGSGNQDGTAQAIAALNQVAGTITQTITSVTEQATAAGQSQAAAQQAAVQNQEDSREGHIMLNVLEANREADAQMFGTGLGAPRHVRNV